MQSVLSSSTVVEAVGASSSPTAHESVRELFLDAILVGVVQKASDWHFTPGEPVGLRVHGEIVKLPVVWPVDGGSRLVEQNFFQPKGFVADEVFRVLHADLGDPKNRTADFEVCYELAGVQGEFMKVRFRAHVKYQRGLIGVGFRRIGLRIPSMDELGTPKGFRELFKRRKGLLLVVGETGSGKSTTLAASITAHVANSCSKLCTYEHPIEYDIPQGRSVVQQHTVGGDIPDFESAIMSAMREDPDQIMIGEMRSPGAILSAIHAADTGHLVLGTLHTGSAPQTISRLLNAAPDSTKEFYRGMIAQSLLGVLCQKLLPRIGGGRVAAYEFLKVNTAIRAQINEGRINLIKASMTQGMGDGMFTFARHLAELVYSGAVTEETARDAVEDDAADFSQQLKNLREKKGPLMAPPPTIK